VTEHFYLGLLPSYYQNESSGSGSESESQQ